MTNMRIPDPFEFISVMLMIVGLLTVAAFTIGAVISTVHWLVSATTWQMLKVAVPSLLAGIWLGVALAVFYIPAEEVEG